MAKVGLLGGSFNPIHLGHLVLAEQARERLALERVLLVPNGLPPHKARTSLAPAADRLRMVELAAAGHPAFEPSAAELHRDGASYSLHTVRGLLADHPDWDLHFLIGADTLPELPSWYRIRELAGLCRFAVANRPGSPLDDAFESLSSVFTAAQVEGIRSRIVEIPPLGISSSDIRRRVREGLSIRYLVPEPVREYILERRLYQP